MTAPAGLRERKKAQTRERIQREAMRLFEAHGFDATTIEDIAEAAEISPSTFFNYFPNKEDVILYDRYDPIALEFLAEGPPDESASAALRRMMNGLAGIFRADHDIILARSKLGLAIPEVRARMWDEVERSRQLFAVMLASRVGRDPEDFELRVITMTVVVAAFTAMIEWVRTDGQGDILQLVNRALDVVDAGARLDALAATTPR